jgi:hypothetical protein
VPPEEDEMHPILAGWFAAHIADFHQQAAGRRLARELRAGQGRATRRRRAG